MQQSQFLVQNPPQAPISKESNKNDEFRAQTGNCVGIIDFIMPITYYMLVYESQTV